ncbi:hypothetical protein I4F81_008084 [Pyropia yezoensis]|uniref:Uncharacterized protein n=1 Tax=Pyropia yezoensis TaxID=2788 RepID=A0ACC3C642_PYRYE|nr:hypothetical protein I4F81_008084 [Neopyropia yezoensis]
MNVADTEVVRALLLDAGYTVVPDPASAAVVVLNTCAIRDNAERRVWARLQALRAADRKRRVPPRRRRPGLPPLPDAPGGGHPLAAVPPAADPMVVTAAGGPPAGGECAEGVGTAAAPGSADGPSAAFVPPARRGRPPKQLIALLGCMAERLKASLLTGPGRLVDVSGSDAVLARMRRGYAVAAYMELVDGLRAAAGGEGHLALSTDLIAGFCGETPADHEATLRLVATVGYDAAFMFAYSERARTSAATRLADDVPTGVKAARLREVIDTFHATAAARAAALVGTRQLVLVDGPGRRGSGRVPGVAPAEPGPSAAFGDGGDGGGGGAVWSGRTDGNRRALFAADAVLPCDDSGDGSSGGEWANEGPRPATVGDWVEVEVVAANSVTLFCTALRRVGLRAYGRPGLVAGVGGCGGGRMGLEVALPAASGGGEGAATAARLLRPV